MQLFALFHLPCLSLSESPVALTTRGEQFCSLLLPDSFPNLSDINVNTMQYAEQLLMHVDDHHKVSKGITMLERVDISGQKPDF